MKLLVITVICGTYLYIISSDNDYNDLSQLIPPDIQKQYDELKKLQENLKIQRIELRRSRCKAINNTRNTDIDNEGSQLNLFSKSLNLSELQNTPLQDFSKSNLI